MAKQSPKYRGIYAYVASQKPNGTSVKQNPKYRGIYAFDATNKPSGVALAIERAENLKNAREGGDDSHVSPLGRSSEPRATGNWTDNRQEEGEAVSSDVEPAPWDDFSTHAQLDDYLNENGDLDRPGGWDRKTVAQKKQWLDENG